MRVPSFRTTPFNLFSRILAKEDFPTGESTIERNFFFGGGGGGNTRNRLGPLWADLRTGFPARGTEEQRTEWRHLGTGNSFVIDVREVCRADRVMTTCDNSEENRMELRFFRADELTIRRTRV